MSRSNQKKEIMKILKYSLVLMLVFSFMACEKSFEELEVDNNRPVAVPASLVLQSIQFDMYNNTGRAFGAEMRWNQFYCSNYNYYANNEYTWSEVTNHFFTMKNVIKMEEGEIYTN